MNNRAIFEIPEIFEKILNEGSGRIAIHSELENARP